MIRFNQLRAQRWRRGKQKRGVPYAAVSHLVTHSSMTSTQATYPSWIVPMIFQSQPTLSGTLSSLLNSMLGILLSLFSSVLAVFQAIFGLGAELARSSFTLVKMVMELGQGLLAFVIGSFFFPNKGSWRWHFLMKPTLWWSWSLEDSTLLIRSLGGGGRI